MRRRSLLFLRVALGLFLIVWGGDKLVNVAHGLQVAEHFYFGVVSSAALMRMIGVVQVLAGAAIVAGVGSRVTYPLLLVITGATLLAVWKSIIDPLELVLDGGNPVFFSSLVIFAGALVLWASAKEASSRARGTAD